MKPGLHIDAIEERFFIHGRMEILALLNELIYRCEPVEVHFGSHECTATRLLEAREHSLVFEAGEDAATNVRLATAEDCTFLASPQGIQVVFASGPVTPVEWDACAAFSVPLPTRLARLQRQESLRTIVPPQQAPDVALYAEDGALLGRWPLRDLSVGGLGVALPDAGELTQVAKATRICLHILGYGDAHCDVVVRHVTGLGQTDADCGFRIGLSFTGLQEPLRVAMLRYIVEIERQRRMASLPCQAED